LCAATAWLVSVCDFAPGLRPKLRAIHLASNESQPPPGINFEHSFIDGHTVLRFASDIFTETILRFAELIRGGFIARTSGARDVEAVQAVTHKIVFRRVPKLHPDVVGELIPAG
jgi:hypothetical protein